MEGDVFEIRLDPKGASVLMRLKNLVGISFILSIAITLVDLTIAYIRFNGYLKLMKASPSIMRFQSNASFVYLLVYPLLLVAEVYLFYRFAEKVNSGIRYGNSTEFNESFRWLLWHVAFALILFFINLLMSVLMLYTEYEITRMYLT